MITDMLISVNSGNASAAIRQKPARTPTIRAVSVRLNFPYNACYFLNQNFKDLLQMSEIIVGCARFDVPEETDPTGRKPGDPGAKLDKGKPRISLVINGFPRALWAVAEVATYGASKYSDGGWQSVPNGQERYFDAGLRHMLKKAMGEERDLDSGLLHLQQKAWNALAELELYLRENGTK